MLCYARAKRYTVQTRRPQAKGVFIVYFTANEDKSLSLPDKVLESLFSPSCDPKEVVRHLEQSLLLNQASLEHPEPGTKRLIRCLAMKAKRSNRLDVVKHLREITPAGSTGKLGITWNYLIHSCMHILPV